MWLKYMFKNARAMLQSFSILGICLVFLLTALVLSASWQAGVEKQLRLLEEETKVSAFMQLSYDTQINGNYITEMKRDYFDAEALEALPQVEAHAWLAKGILLQGEKFFGSEASLPIVELDGRYSEEEQLEIHEYNETRWEEQKKRIEGTSLASATSVFFTNSLQSTRFFINGDLALTAGRDFTPEEYASQEQVTKCLLEAEYAQVLDLQVGDTLYIVDFGYEYLEGHGPPNGVGRRRLAKFEIIGIFHAYDRTVQGAAMIVTPSVYEHFMVQDPRADLFGTADEELEKAHRNYTYMELTYLLKEPSLVRSFMEEAMPLVKQKGITVAADDAGYKLLAIPLKNMAQTTSFLFAFVTFAVAVTMVVFMMLYSRKRRAELGILRCMGQTKWRCIALVYAETWMLTLPAFVLALFFGAVGAELAVNEFGFGELLRLLPKLATVAAGSNLLGGVVMTRLLVGRTPLEIMAGRDL